MPSVLEPADLFHTGIVVADLDTALRDLTAVGGYRWTTPMTNTIAVRIGDQVRDVEFRMSYSVQAPHLELVQQIPGTLWMPSPGTAAHHLGYFVDDVAATSSRLDAAGFAFEAGTEVFAYHNNPLGIRIELVQRGLFGDWTAFLAATS
ncbi:VOC family protein [Mycolicibacterium mengxianglii]|uniref:VOC family protein n=1 Tax=Mycolicibacterium mengxianglii TaxID=2736649 RepID=UPI0018D0D706|nr:VOC family protein [Mycolicibacterium mengxianglii]